MRHIALLTLGALLVLTPGAHASSEGASVGWVGAQWLKAHMDEKGVRIVDVSLRPDDYEKAHIPNAVYVDWKSDLSDPKEKKYYRVAPREKFEEVMARIGATPQTTLIFYDNLQNRLAIRALWVMAFYGHDKAAILEGGISAWKSAGFQTTVQVPRIPPTSYRAQKVRAEMNLEMAAVKANLRSKGVLFLDARPWKMYTGEKPGILIHSGQEVARRGHLPGAIHLPWKENIDGNSMFHDKGTLMRNYLKRGVRQDKRLIFYCNEGVHAAYNWFVATRILGFKDVKIYEGSMGEWADHPLLPMVSGIGF